jgi:hypothetical protein
MRPLLVSATLLCLIFPALPVAAQHHDHGAPGGAFPPGWQGRVDRPTQDIAEVRFTALDGGFHVITGPHVILWHPERTATGEYRASVTFVQERAPDRLEGFGLLVGGQALDQPGQDYLYFLMRHDGRYMIRHRAGEEVHTLAPWTEAAAVQRAGADTRASNTLAIETRTDSVAFLINDTVVHTLPRATDLNTDGIVGFRVGHHLDVHVRDFTIGPRQ